MTGRPPVVATTASAFGVVVRPRASAVSLDWVSGHYYEGTKDAQPDPQADDPAARAWLRRLSDSLIAR